MKRKNRMYPPSAIGTSWRLAFVLALAPCLPACASKASDAAPTAAPAAAEPSDAPPAAASFDDQVARGQALYGQHCASCHGADGTGDSAPAVVGPGVLTRFANAAEVFAFASEKMPGNAPGSLTDEDMLAILAFDLHANGIALEAPLAPANAADISLGAP